MPQSLQFKQLLNLCANEIMNKMQKTLPLLTSLRFVAAMEVLVFHVFQKQLSGVNPRIRDLFSNGYEAVLFFFLLSGFVLTRSYLQSEQTNDGIDYFTYYRNRIARIYPVYYLSLLIAAPAFLYNGLIVRGGKSDAFNAGLILAPIALQSWYPPAALTWNPPAWSLSVEVSFYAIMPFLIPRFTRISLRMQVMTSFILILMVEAVRALLGGEHLATQLSEITSSNNFRLYFPVWFAPVFLLGAALAKAYEVYPLTIRTANAMLKFSVASILLLFCCRSLLPAWCISMPIVVVLFGLLLFSAASSECWLSRILSTRLLLLLGQASYALYILHVPLHFWWLKLVYQSSSITAWYLFEPILFCCFAVAVSILCFLYFELPLQMMMRRALNNTRK
jgi:peptidoglycan/LPS O-acetylase OafA/YrhL